MGYKARFVPQAWINDYAVDIDALGETDWDLTDAEAAQALSEARRPCPDLDYLREHFQAPAWVREYPGPFRVELLGSDGFPVD